MQHPPKTWLMMGKKAGDNAQIAALAEALGWPFEIKNLAFRKAELITNLLAGPTLTGVMKAQPSSLAPHWPDLMMSAGRRNEPACCWVQARGGGAKPVHVGRHWTPLECFDLIVTTTRYRLPDVPVVLQNPTPLHRVTDAFAMPVVGKASMGRAACSTARSVMLLSSSRRRR